MTTATHLSLIAGETVTATTASGTINTGRYIGFQAKANTPDNTTEYEAIVRWNGTDYDSIVPLERLAPTAQPAVPDATRQAAIQAAAAATRTWQADPTTAAFTAMLAAIDTATELGATNDNIIAAFATTQQEDPMCDHCHSKTGHHVQCPKF